MVVQEYSERCLKMDNFVQKPYYACCPLLDLKLGYIFCILDPFQKNFFDRAFGPFWVSLDFFLKINKSKYLKAKDENYFNGEEGEL